MEAQFIYVAAVKSLKSENKVWAVEEYLSMMGGFTDEDREYLRETDPELLSLEENEDDD